jgi:hypothetical protein
MRSRTDSSFLMMGVAIDTYREIGLPVAGKMVLDAVTS